MKGKVDGRDQSILDFYKP